MAGFILLAASTKNDGSGYWRLWSLEAQFTKTTTAFVLKGTLHVVMDLCCFDQASSKKQLSLVYSLSKLYFTQRPAPTLWSNQIFTVLETMCFIYFRVHSPQHSFIVSTFFQVL